MRRYIVFGTIGVALTAILSYGYIYQERLGKSLGRLRMPRIESPVYTVERTEYKPPAPAADDLFHDDDPQTKNPTFDPDLVDSRPEGDWRVNLSAAVMRLDCPMLLPDQDAGLDRLSKSYADAVREYRKRNPGGVSILPSINMIDGKAKQFDDGLFAAIDQAYYDGIDQVLVGHLDLLKRFRDKLDPKSNAGTLIAAALKLAEIESPEADARAVDEAIRFFDAAAVRSKPAGFYTWSPKLSQLFRVLRFLQASLDPSTADQLVDALAADPALARDYEAANAFFDKFSNPHSGLTLTDYAKNREARSAIHFFPPSSNKESQLFSKLFPRGLPPDADLMRTLVTAIRSGKVDLKPKAGSGWYDHQVYALETLLLPEKGAENAKLVLTKQYKKRMLEAFKAMMTKRRETHLRTADVSVGAPAPRPLERLSPRLRLEPAPTYYLRTARAYDFIGRFLDSTLGKPALEKLHGLREGGERESTLAAELDRMRSLFYGFYLLSSEDIGSKTEFASDESVDADKCMKLASEWLEKCVDDIDLAADTRVAVPVYVNPAAGRVRCWGTLGVRLAKFDARFVKPPSIKPISGDGDWKPVTNEQLRSVQYLIPVDEFGEFELTSMQFLTRPEFRAICDAGGTKEAILKALSH
ncbi:MAG: hypothetical protein SFX72_12195 [Isosphaeraceae bacterium]|nr:hypothetical protein [Isosphaeraceae bacterium]